MCIEKPQKCKFVPQLLSMIADQDPRVESLPGLCHAHKKDTVTMSLGLLVVCFSLGNMAGIYMAICFKLET